MVTLRKPTRVSDENQEIDLVTGGGGYVGFWLGKTLAKHSHRVILMDVHEPVWTLQNNMEFVQCDITNTEMMKSVFHGVDSVYHIASYGMSGRDQLNRKRIEDVNVKGTDCVIEACKANDVTRLVYTSTYNTIFGGQTIENGDESLPYLPLDKHPDHYSRTKSIAEQKVLAADGAETRGGKTLHTCALRLAAVYGPGEQRHIPRIVDYVERGLFCVKYATDTKQDFLHVENLVQALELAAIALSDKKHFIAAGQAYFVSDDSPINTLTFFQPLIEGLGYSMPSISLPLSVVYFIAYLTEWLHFLVSKIYNFQPLLTRTEVYKTGVTHWFSICKAREQLGYCPTIQNDISEVVLYYTRTGHQRPLKSRTHKLIYWIENIVLFVVMAFFMLSFVPIVK